MTNESNESNGSNESNASKPTADDGTLYLGIDLGGTNVQIGVVTGAGEVLSRAKRKTLADEGRDAVLDRVVDGIEEACAGAKVKLKDIRAIGMGAPGPVDPHKGVVLEAVNLGWLNEPIAEILSERLGLPLYLDNDVNVAVYGEWKMGAAQGATNMMGVWIGTGVGGGFILNSALYYGSFLTAGEVGHMLMSPDNPPGVRSVEHNCSRTAMCNRVRQLIEAGRESIVPELVDGKMHKIKSKTLAEAFRREDELVSAVVRDAGDRLGIVLGGIVTLLSIDKIVLGGGLTEAIGEPWVELVRDSARRVAFPAVCKKVSVVASVLEDNAGVIGAALIAAERDA